MASPVLADTLFSGLPWPIVIAFWIELVLIALVLVWCIALSIAAAPARPPRRAFRVVADDFLWVFLVPALNEEVTIADSVARLRQVEARNKVILVVDDGSDDATGAILAELETEASELSVITPATRGAAGQV